MESAWTEIKNESKNTLEIKFNIYFVPFRYFYDRPIFGLINIP